MNKSVVMSYLASIVALIVIVGISYAYLALNVSGTSTNSSVKTARLGRIGYVITSPQAESVLPGWKGNGSTSVYFTSSADYSTNY